MEAWRRGERVDWRDRASWWHPFHQAVADAVARGVAVRRARVVSEPVSEYIRWEHAATSGNIIAGEEVRWLPRSRAQDVLLPANDFWLFDGELLRVHHFAGDGSLVADELSVDPHRLELCAAGFDAVWQRGTTHREFTVDPSQRRSSGR